MVRASPWFLSLFYREELGAEENIEFVEVFASSLFPSQVAGLVIHFSSFLSYMRFYGAGLT
jgi:hypothetical protein